jgi:hypothetical protein
MRSIKYEDYNWVLRCIDVNTKFGTSVPLKGKEAKTVGYELAVIWARMGTPSILQSDNGSEFMGDCLKIVRTWSGGAVKVINGR